MAETHPIPTHFRFKNFVGRRYGRLIVLSFAGATEKRNRSQWLCRCDCGVEKVVPQNQLPRLKSCGCAKHSRLEPGLSTSPEYRSWCQMRLRCSDGDHEDFHLYGARGIRVCDRWLNFRHFLEDMGSRPAGTSIDRIDNNGNYEQANCRWATALEQANNKRNNRRLTLDGVTMTLPEWARQLGVPANRLHQRVYRGWTDEQILQNGKITKWSRRRGARLAQPANSRPGAR